MAAPASVSAHGVLEEASRLQKGRTGWPSLRCPAGTPGPPGTGSGPVSASLPGFLPRGGFFTDTSESDEEDEEADEEEQEADLATAAGSPLAPSDSGLESESEAEGGFWERPRCRGEGRHTAPCSPPPTRTRTAQIRHTSFRPGITGRPGCASSGLSLHCGHRARPPTWASTGTDDARDAHPPSGKGSLRSDSRAVCPRLTWAQCVCMHACALITHSHMRAQT